jgi:hypothetical protein
MSVDPVTAAITIGMAVARHEAERKAARAQARTLEETATRAQEQAAFEESETRRSNRRLLGRQRALFAKSGVRVEGTPLDVQTQIAEEGELDALMRRRRGDAEAASLLGRARSVRASSEYFPLFR